MSFSVETKRQLASLELGNKKQETAEIMAYTRTLATVSIGYRDEIKISMASESSAVTRRIYKIIKDLYGYEAKISVVKNSQLRQKNLYKLLVEDEMIVRFILEDSGYQVEMDFSLDLINRLEPKALDRLASKAFLRGAFLGSGYVMDPKDSYHLELVLNSRENAVFVEEVSKNLGIEGRFYKRRDSYVYYLKDGQSVSEFLGQIGASSAMLTLEDTMILKDVKNRVNRIVNAETANLGKTVNAAMRQTEAIDKIQKEIGLSSLPANLQEIALARLDNPDASLKELGESLKKPLGKSGVNHRMKRILEISEDL